MRIEPTDGVTFGYKSPLKTLYKKGKLNIDKGVLWWNVDERKRYP